MNYTDKPAILGGKPLFEETMQIIRPETSKYWNSTELKAEMDEIFNSGLLTASGPWVERFEEKFASYMDGEHAVGLSCCTSGLMLVIQALGLAGKEVILPSFTFSATAHAAAWNGCALKFADIDDTLCLDPDDVESKISEETGFILGVHMYGMPCHVERFEEISKKYNIPVIYDAAHAVGSKMNGKGLGAFGTASVYSFSPTKIMTTIEGGMLLTPDADLAEKIRLDRNYSNHPDYRCDRPGLSARLANPHAALGYAQMDDAEGFVQNREKYAEYMRTRLSALSGVSFQETPDGCRPGRKDFSIFVNAEKFGMDRDKLGAALERENIAIKKYFYPPVHMLDAYAEYKEVELPVTMEKTTTVLSLPVYNHMRDDETDRLCLAVEKIQKHAEEVIKALSRES